MKPLNSSDTGLIGPGQTAAAVDHSAAAQQAAPSAAQSEPSQGLVDVSLPQLPADMPPIEPPEFYLARKVSEDSQNLGTVPPGMPGLSGNQISDPSDILAGIPSDVSSLLDGANAAVNQAAAPVLGAAQGVLGQAQSALGGGGAASAAATPAASAVPSLPADPVAALMSGLSLPALPGVDTLFKPILDLLSSFGTGVLGSIDPTQILSQSSKIIESAMQVGKGSMTTVEQLWQGQSARSAQVAGQQANTTGQDTSQRGFDISDLTQKAAAVVQQGNAQLSGIATSFATQATALAPAVLTPPGQAALIATATEHLGQAVSVANATRGDLAGKTAELTGLVNQLIAPAGGPAPQEVAQAVMQNIGEPIMGQAQEAGSNAAGLLSDSSNSSSGTPTNAASAGSSTPASGSGLGNPGHSGLPGGSGSSGTPSSPSTPKLMGLPGATMSPIPVSGMLGSGLPGSALGSSGLSTSAASTGNSSYMGGGGGAGAAGQRGNNDEEHERNVDPYQSRTGNDDLTGPLGESTPDVIGATHTDEMVSSDYDQDQF
ncbi:hypothetical protein [Nocardia australiensis]|uniref:hypothetical protein n=1 Tax=Nocardia australiensis TaxID=2887191 RepID=UPI001D14B1AA|nr:hypothetical protein [Nocardia australiensis]